MSTILFLAFIIVLTEPATIHYEEEKYLANVTQLTFSGVNAEAYFSFDGRQILFQSTNYEMGTQGCDQIFNLRLDDPGAVPKMVSNGKGRTTCSFFLADNRQFIYSTTFHHDPSCPLTVCNRDNPPAACKGRHPYLWDVFPSYDIVLSDGSGNIVFLSNNTYYDAEGVVSPDGSMIAFTSDRSGDLELWLMDIHGNIIRQLTNETGYDGGAFFSPDGSRLVYRAYHPKHKNDEIAYKELLAHHAVSPSLMEIFTININGTDVKQVTHLGGANWAPFFHPDGKRIIFSSNHDKSHPFTFNLYLVDENGQNLKRITYDPVFDSFPMFSRDGKKLVFISARNNTGTQQNHTMNIFIADWVDSSPRVIHNALVSLSFVLLFAYFYAMF